MRASVEHPALTYMSYLHLDELLACQEPLSDGPEHDELLFIVIHQVYELWFKVMLHEAAYLQRSLEAGDSATALAAMKRILTILKTVVAQVDVLETMTPLAFRSFRGRLERASGFQSAQFRELEAVLGRRDRGVLADHPPGPGRDRITAAMERPSLYESFLAYVGLAGRPQAEVRDGLVEVYRTDPARAQVCERMVDIDEGIQEWRYRHVKMVERTIGEQAGNRRIGRRRVPALDALPAGLPRPLGDPGAALASRERTRAARPAPGRCRRAPSTGRPAPSRWPRRR